MTYNLDYLSEFFDAGSAETEREFLEDVFITTDEFIDIVKPRNNTIKILMGNKGSGKSALLSYLRVRSKEMGIPVIQLTPTDFTEWDFKENTSPASMISNIYGSIVKAMAIELGKNQQGLLNENESELMEEAVVDGAIEDDDITKMIKFLSPIGKALTKIDFAKMLPTYKLSTSSRRRAISKYMSDKKVFYVLLDDIDQICNAKRGDYFDVIWAEILALLKIATTIPNVVPIVSVRREIWRKLSADNGNRDKYDQIRNMVYILSSNREILKEILERRLQVCIDRYEIDANGVYEPFFEGDDCRVPNSSQRRTWHDYLVSSSRENPRDLVQLVSGLIKNAKGADEDRITDWDVENTALGYSKERVRDLVNQNKDIYDDLERLIRSFCKIDFELQPDTLRKHLETYLRGGNIILYGKRITQLKEMIIKMWDLLFNIGFISARMADNTKKRGFSFIAYDETLVSWSRWNDVQKYTWDVHPCYRSYLFDIREQEKKNILSNPQVDNYKGKTTYSQRKKRKRK